MRERINHNVTFINNRDNPPFDTAWAKIESLHKNHQEINKEISLMRSHIEVSINSAPPFRIIPISDTHLFTTQTDLDKVKKIMSKLEDPNTYGVIMGDLIEGANSKIYDHIGNVELSFFAQIMAAKKFIEPYVSAGKILCLVGAYDGHEGWSNADAVQLIAEGLKHPDGSPLLVLYNGGRLTIHPKDGEPFSMLAYHDPGGGGSDEVNPLGAQRNRLKEFIKNNGIQVDAVGGGHWHHRAGVSEELIIDLGTGKERSSILFSNGTIKGNDPDYPDVYVVKMAKGPTLTSGVQLIFNNSPKNGEHRNGDHVWVTYGYDKGEISYDASKLWDRATEQSVAAELIGEIIEREGKPKIKFDRNNSRTKLKDNRFDTPMFETLKWRVETPDALPILVHFLGNTRYPSTSFEKRDREEFLRMLKSIETNPFKYGLILRHMVDTDVAGQFDRDEILDGMIEDLSKCASQDRLLGFMISGSLLLKKWKKEVLGDWYDEEYEDVKGNWRTIRVRDRKDALNPGDYIYRGLGRRVPLYLNNALMHLDFGNKVKYEFLFKDKLDYSGSDFDMFRGLVQARSLKKTSSDIVVGGHMSGAGFMDTPGAIYIAPGWFSEYDSKSKDNATRVPLGGQGTILLPDTKMAIPAATFSKATDIHMALMLLRGLKEEEKKKILFKTNR